MDITWLGHSSFRINGKTSSVITDPYDEKSVGIKFPKNQKADIVTISHAHRDHNQSKLVHGNPKIISGPGEYEIRGVSIFGIHSYHDKQKGADRGPNTIYLITIDKIRICHLGDLGHKLEENHIGKIGEIDILLIPVGGFYTINSSEAVSTIAQLEPKVVMPMHYKTVENSSKFNKLETVDNFIKELGADPIKTNKYITTYDKLPEDLEVVILERKI